MPPTPTPDLHALRSPLLRFFASPASPRIFDAAGAHSYAEIVLGARRVAQALGRMGDERGKRVAVLVSPGAGFLEAFFGVLAAGGCVVVLSPLHPHAETAYFCDDAEVGTILVSRDLEERVTALGPGRRVLRLDEVRAREGADDAGEIATPRPTDAALQLYTSGTTGKPKGAVLTHDNLAVQQDLLGAAWGWRPGDVLLHALPLHHLHGLGIALLTALGAGASVRMLPAFDATAIWDAMAVSTVVMGVPTMYTKLFACFDAADEPTRARWTEGARGLRLATSGSAALPVSLGERWRALTGRYPLERFGMTEIGVGMTNPLDGERRPGCVGMPLPSVLTRIVGEDGKDAPSGELWIRGPSVFSGYWKRDDATRDAFVDGWFRTGDTVTREDGGAFKILGRTSVDILKSGGYKLSALEIEEVLREHPAIAEVAVIGLPDATWGERVVACVIPHAGREAECAEAPVRAFAKTKLAAYKVPKTVLVVTELPRNAVGKVVKPELAKRVAPLVPTDS
jgi:malonyl-CoA/methylmalonyl-CoA synthetase